MTVWSYTCSQTSSSCTLQSILANPQVIITAACGGALTPLYAILIYILIDSVALLITVVVQGKKNILFYSTLFRLVFCLFRFNRNSETLSFGIETKQPKQTFCFGQCRNQFLFQFRLFRIETSFEGHPNLAYFYLSVAVTYLRQILTKLFFGFDGW